MSLARTSAVRFRPAPIVFLILLSSGIFAGCFVTEFITAYFNTYYNAQRLFQEAEDEIWSQPETKSSGKNYLLVFNPSQAAKTKFTSVIEKASKLLQYHPNSDLVDDALLMIGKSYYYQNENQKAERKFKELLAGYPKSGYVLEARMLLASAYYRMRNFPDALALAKDVEADALTEGEKGIAGRAALVMAQAQLENKDTASARIEFQNAADFGDNGDFRAAAYMTAAQLESQAGNNEVARSDYQKAEAQASNYIGEFRAKIGAARTRVRMGQIDEAIDEMRTLRANTNNREFYGEIEYEIGAAYRDGDRIRPMMEQFRFVDSVYVRTEWSARSYLQSGDFYEHRFLMYDSARANYNRGRLEAPAGPVAEQLAKRSDYMNRYFQSLGEIIKFDSVKTRLLFLRDSLESAKKNPDTVKVAVVDTSAKAPVAPAFVPPAMTVDSAESRLVSAKSELAGLFYTVIDLPDSARYWYDNIIANHPGSKVYPRALFVKAEMASKDSIRGKPVSDSLYRVIVERFPRSSFAAEAKRLLGLPPDPVVIDPAEASYRSGEILMLEGKNLPAIDSLRSLVRRFPTAPAAPRAQYTIGFLYERLPERSDSALSAYRTLLAAYPSSLFSQIVSPRVAEFDLQVKMNAQAAADTAAAILKAKKKLVPDDEILPRPDKDRKKPGNALNTAGAADTVQTRKASEPPDRPARPTGSEKEPDKQ